METKKSRGWRYRMPKIAAVLLHFCLGYGYAERAYGQSASDEYRMKAIYLRKLPTFVEWPLQNKGKQGSGPATIHVCVAGNYSFGVFLGQEAVKASESGQKMDVRHLDKSAEWKGCQVLFVSRSEEKHYGKILEALKGGNVLTVGETAEFLESGGIVELCFENGRMQFEVNLAAARTAQLKIDARLLAMAKRVIREKERVGS
jgi:YfiR/HmsC-like